MERDQDDGKRAQAHSMRNREEVGRSASCGCFFCMATFPAADVAAWGGEGAATAACPKCGMDAVVGDASGLPVTDRAWLAAMNSKWF